MIGTEHKGYDPIPWEVLNFAIALEVKKSIPRDKTIEDFLKFVKDLSNKKKVFGIRSKKELVNHGVQMYIVLRSEKFGLIKDYRRGWNSRE